MGFRCVAVVGDGKGRVGVGCQAGREVSTAVKRALVDAKKVGGWVGELPVCVPRGGVLTSQLEDCIRAQHQQQQRPAAQGRGGVSRCQPVLQWCTQ